MSGRRCKALRRAFRAEFGRPPSVVEVRSAGLPYRIGMRHTRAVSEWRRLKKAYARGLL